MPNAQPATILGELSLKPKDFERAPLLIALLGIVDHNRPPLCYAVFSDLPNR